MKIFAQSVQLNCTVFQSNVTLCLNATSIRDVYTCDRNGFGPTQLVIVLLNYCYEVTVNLLRQPVENRHTYLVLNKCNFWHSLRNMCYETIATNKHVN